MAMSMCQINFPGQQNAQANTFYPFFDHTVGARMTTPHYPMQPVIPMVQQVPQYQKTLNFGRCAIKNILSVPCFLNFILLFYFIGRNFIDMLQLLIITH